MALPLYTKDPFNKVGLVLQSPYNLMYHAMMAASIVITKGSKTKSPCLKSLSSY